ncbi:hypothetical protein [Streptomyces sp. NPDC059247]|uniref:hypothetical protein n=1 Tax=Streptomyces sp. NPDC059247 TaxID=3346790 RepID=UPI0036A8BD9F
MSGPPGGSTASALWKAGCSAYRPGGLVDHIADVSPSGGADDMKIDDGSARSAEPLKHLPATAGPLRELGPEYGWVRLARLESNSFLWEHHDDGELSEAERYRLRVPLNTDSSASS